MSPRAAAALAAASFLAVPLDAVAATIHVPGDQPTIQAGIDAAAVGDTVLVAPGTYSDCTHIDENGWNNCAIIDKDLTLRSDGGPDVTVIDAQGGGRGLRVLSEALVEGFTITNAIVYGYDGGGIFHRGGPLILRDCVLRDNRSFKNGGGLYSELSVSLVVDDCLFMENRSSWNGGGLASHLTATVLVARCEFRGNSTGSNHHGGGASIAPGTGGKATIRHCSFVENFAHYAGGLEAVLGSFDVTDCTFFANEAFIQGGGAITGAGTGAIQAFRRCTFSGNSAGVGWGGGISILQNSQVEMDQTVIAFSTAGNGVHGFNPESAELSCCNIFGNAGGDWVGTSVQGELGQRGNFSADPLFCDPEGGNFTLSSQSPCLPGNHPDGADCGLIGALGQGCGPIAITPESWARIKGRYR